ncbi:hypothetical protein OPO46_001803, partial [Campylobacter coli]|nr:hypothetical protein [Campylobacter coli]
KNAIRLISEYELENYFHYDYVFVLRSDIEINEMSKNIINSLLFSEFNTIFENIGDGVAYGNRFVMDAYGSMYDKIEYILKNNFSVIGNHSFIPTLLNFYGINRRKSEISFSISSYKSLNYIIPNIENELKLDLISLKNEEKKDIISFFNDFDAFFKRLNIKFSLKSNILTEKLTDKTKISEYNND